MASLRVHVLQQTAETPAGSVLDWLKARGHAATLVRVFAGDALPTVNDTDWLVICGGSMNVDDTTEFPFLLEEKKLLKEAIAAHKTCLGLCLGGQLLSRALGGTVSKNSEWEQAAVVACNVSVMKNQRGKTLKEGAGTEMLSIGYS